MRFGWDLDGCAVLFAPTLRRYLTLRHGWTPDRCPDPTRWEFYLDWGLSLEDFVAVCDAAADEGVLFRAQPEPGVIDAANRVLRAGHELHIVTDRQFGAPGRSKSLTLSWLIRHAHPYTSLTMSADKTSVPCDVFVEDKPDNYRALLAAGVDAYLLSRPWNQGTDEWRDAHARGRVVESVAQYVDRVLAVDERLAA
jgi:hypothetical protein